LILAVTRGVAVLVVDICIGRVDRLISSCASPSTTGLTGGTGNCFCNKQCAFEKPPIKILCGYRVLIELSFLYLCRFYGHFDHLVMLFSSTCGYTASGLLCGFRQGCTRGGSEFHSSLELVVFDEWFSLVPKFTPAVPDFRPSRADCDSSDCWSSLSFVK
jgi:hypothetical protein